MLIIGQRTDNEHRSSNINWKPNNITPFVREIKMLTCSACKKFFELINGLVCEAQYARSDSEKLEHLRSKLANVIPHTAYQLLHSKPEGEVKMSTKGSSDIGSSEIHFSWEMGDPAHVVALLNDGGTPLLKVALDPDGKPYIDYFTSDILQRIARLPYLEKCEERLKRGKVSVYDPQTRLAKAEECLDSDAPEALHYAIRNLVHTCRFLLNEQRANLSKFKRLADMIEPKIPNKVPESDRSTVAPEVAEGDHPS